MKQERSNGESGTRRNVQGSQTLLRGLDMLDKVVDGPVRLNELSERMQLTRSTTHRLANALVDRGFLTFVPHEGYHLGPKLLSLGFLAQRQVDLIRVARDHLVQLAGLSEDTVHLGRRDADQALYLEKIPGRRRIEISSRVGDRHPLASTGLGKALMLDDPEESWPRQFKADKARGAPVNDYGVWRDRMIGYVAAGRTFDLEENEDMIRCVAAPIRDASGAIVAAISVSSAAQYMDDARMDQLGGDVRRTADAISAELGWIPDTES